MNLESDLRAALRREPAPPDFAAKVLREAGHNRWQRVFALPLAAGIAAVALIPAAYQHQQHQRAIQAKQELVAALAITNNQLERVKEKIHRNSRHTP